MASYTGEADAMLIYESSLRRRLECRKADLYQQLNCARAWFNLTGMKATGGAAHLKIRDTTPPKFGAVASTL